MAQPTPVKCWTITLNNPMGRNRGFGNDDDFERMFNPDLMFYMIKGNEIGKEGKKDHWQIYLHLKVKVRFNTIKGLCYRGHIEKAKGSDWQNHVYCSKDGVFSEWGQIPNEPKEKDTTYEEALAAPTVEQRLALVKEKRPRDYCLHGESIERNLKNHKKSVYVAKYKPEEFNRELLTLDKSTLICGQTNTGKTHFACAHFKNPLVVSNFEKVKKLTPDHDGIVFDDMSFRHWPPETVIHLLDQDFERQFKVLYGTTTIPANTKKIFTHNLDNPFYKECDLSLEQIEPIERRLNRVIVLGKLY